MYPLWPGSLQMARVADGLSQEQIYVYSCSFSLVTSFFLPCLLV